jgi:hypothetical protein
LRPWVAAPTGGQNQRGLGAFERRLEHGDLFWPVKRFLEIFQRRLSLIDPRPGLHPLLVEHGRRHCEQVSPFFDA